MHPYSSTIPASVGVVDDGGQTASSIFTENKTCYQDAARDKFESDAIIIVEKQSSL